VRVETRYDAKLARQIYGGADMLLMPSRYEPCGISQMIAMRYGCVPIVRAVGGLHDTVTDSETGFAFVEAKGKSFNDAVRRALELFPYSSRWLNMQKAGMALDFSWRASAEKYAVLYKKIVDEMKGAGPREAFPKADGKSGRRIRETEPAVES
jgi:starch synthase